MKALVVGHSAYDIITYNEEFPLENTKKVFQDIESCAGGGATNMAYLIGKFGFDTYLGSVTGDDTYGNMLRKELEGVGVHTEYMETAYDKRTHLAFIIAAKKNNSRTVLKVNKDDLFMKKTDFPIDADGVIVDTYDYGASLAALNKFSSKITMLNVDSLNDNSLQLCKYAGYLLTSQSFAEEVAGQKINFESTQDIVSVYSKLTNKFPGKNIIITIEGKGAIYMVNSEIRVMPGLQGEVVDTTAAGDIFQAAFLFATLNGYDMEMSVTFANIAAGLSVTKRGSTKSCPELSDVMNYFKQKYPDASITAPSQTKNDAPIDISKNSLDSL